MIAELRDHFRAEKRASVASMALGIASLVASLVLWNDGGDARGAVAPLALFGAAHLLLGGGVLTRVDDQVAELLARMGASPAAFRAEEMRRVRRARRTFGARGAVAALLVIVGFALLFTHRPPLAWAGGACGVEACVSLVLDGFAARRAALYLRHLVDFAT